MLKAILFDLDGTLLPMDQEVFTKTYFESLTNRFKELYDPKELIDATWSGIRAMVKNDGSEINSAAFWNAFSDIYGKDVLDQKEDFEEYYKTEFENVSSSCGFNKEIHDVVMEIKSLGYRTVVATNPVFPTAATEKRIRWAGFEPEDFELYTTYDNSHYCKPNVMYYKEILEKIGLEASECMMVGNDVKEDMVAKELGMKVFLLTDCLINSSNEDIAEYPNGGFSDLLDFIKKCK